MALLLSRFLVANSHPQPHARVTEVVAEAFLTALTLDQKCEEDEDDDEPEEEEAAVARSFHGMWQQRMTRDEPENEIICIGFRKCFFFSFFFCDYFFIFFRLLRRILLLLPALALALAPAQSCR